jgi:uncharacterized membrane protein
MTRWLYLAIAVTVLAWAGSMYVYFLQYDRLPEQIPVHWGASGEPDRWVSRDQAWINFWLMPGLMVGFILLTLVLPWLSPRHFEVDRFRDTYGYVMAVVVVLFGYMHFLILRATLHPDFQMVHVMVAGIFLFFALIGNVLGRVRRNFWMGVRTPWTLASEEVWNKTHRLAAWLFTTMGVVGAIAVLLGAPLSWCFIALVVVAIFPVFYSLAIYKRLEKQGRLQ